jgi:hypothetical protein
MVNRPAGNSTISGQSEQSLKVRKDGAVVAAGACAWTILAPAGSCASDMPPASAITSATPAANVIGICAR